MAHPTLEYIRGLRKSLETKKAEIVGESPSNMPGAEHDSKADPSLKDPDPETKDETMVPNSGLTTDGAGDDSKITHTNDLEADEAALTPTKEPEVTGDADAEVPGGKTAEALAAEILSGVNSWYAAQKKAEDTPPAAGEGTAEALITDKGKEPEQTKDVIEPNKKDEISTDALAPATGEGSSGETAAAAKSAGALDMELTSDVLAKIAAVMLATEEGTQLAENVLAKAAGAEAAEKTLNFLRTQNDLAQKQAEYQAGQRDALALIQKMAQECEGEGCCDGEECADAVEEAAGEAAGEDDGGITEIADTLDSMVESGEITEDEADQVVEEIAMALAEGDGEAADDGNADEAALADAVASEEAEKAAQAMDPAAAGMAADPAAAGAVDPAAAGNAAIDNTVAVDPSQLDPDSVPQGGAEDITADDVADAIDTLVDSGEITEDEADQLVEEIVGEGAAEGEAAAQEEVSPEEIATALQEAVANGELQPADVQQVLTELEEVPAPEEEGTAAPAEQAAVAADPAAAGAPTDEPKTAGARLLHAIQASRMAKRAAEKRPVLVRTAPALSEIHPGMRGAQKLPARMSDLVRERLEAYKKLPKGNLGASAK